MVKKHRLLENNPENDGSRKELAARSEITTVSPLGRWGLVSHGWEAAAWEEDVRLGVWRGC